MISMAEKPYLIIGIGNFLRQDDGAGLILAEALRSALDERGLPNQIRQVQQLLPELAEEIGEIQPHTLVIADCRAVGGTGAAGTGESAAAQGEIVMLTAGDGDVSTAAAALGSHGMAPAQFLGMAQRLYGYAGAAWLATVPGVEFGHGQGVSPTTRQAIDRLAPELLKRIG
jgi:hydrogenase maturation protease